MILYKDHIIELDYQPAQDLLITCQPSIRPYDAREVRSAFISIITFVKEYNITRLLLDFTRNTQDLSETEYKTNMAQLTVGLLQTSLQKVARLTTSDAIREQKIASMLDTIQGAVPMVVEVGMFTSKEEAVRWLLHKEG
ncbi:hypothetical protein [Pontibacter populi]|uniref:STAS/SEC14 domain-containing protein n=1 Tax=Pontibacter populi TaxID=890055 RepID=A0ABV1RXT6_9BACT